MSTSQSDSSKSASPTFRFMTWNVLSSQVSFYNLHQWPPSFIGHGIHSSEPLEIRDMRYQAIISEIINGHPGLPTVDGSPSRLSVSPSPDIGCLQEVDGTLAAALIRELHQDYYTSYTYKGRSAALAPQGLFLFYRKSIFQPHPEWCGSLAEWRAAAGGSNVKEEHFDADPKVSFGIDYQLAGDRGKTHLNAFKFAQVACLQTTLGMSVVIVNLNYTTPSCFPCIPNCSYCILICS